MKTVDIRGKAYVPVNERIKEFRKLHPNYSLRTELVVVDEMSALVKAVIRDEKERIIAEGTAHERVDQKGSMVNSTSHVENAETSAWGRALGNFGIGIDASVASADTVANAIARQEQSKPALNVPTAASTSALVLEPIRLADVPTPDRAALVRAIAALCKELNLNIKDVYEKAGVLAGSPTIAQGQKIIEVLTEAKAKATPSAS